MFSSMYLFLNTHQRPFGLSPWQINLWLPEPNLPAQTMKNQGFYQADAGRFTPIAVVPTAKILLPNSGSSG